MPTDRRLPSLGPRGEGWVGLQAIVLLVVLATGALGPAWTGVARLLTTIVGVLAIAGGVGLGVAGAGRLGTDLTPFPRPGPGARLVTSGVFGRVRHPIYGGIVIASAGWALVTASPAAVGAAALTAAFFEVKSRREERWLEDRFPDYAAYRARTRRLIPWLH